MCSHTFGLMMKMYKMLLASGRYTNCIITLNSQQNPKTNGSLHHIVMMTRREQN